MKYPSSFVALYEQSTTTFYVSGNVYDSWCIEFRFVYCMQDSKFLCSILDKYWSDIYRENMTKFQKLNEFEIYITNNDKEISIRMSVCVVW